MSGSVIARGGRSPVGTALGLTLAVLCFGGGEAFVIGGAPRRGLSRFPRRIRAATDEAAASPEKLEEIYYEEAQLYADKTACAIDVVIDITKQEQLDFILAHAAGADPLGAETKPHSMLIIMVHANWCRKCKYMIKKYLSVAKAHPECLCLKLNLSTQPEIAKTLGVRGVPLYILYKKGKRLDHFYCEDEDDLAQHVLDNV